MTIKSIYQSICDRVQIVHLTYRLKSFPLIRRLLTIPRNIRICRNNKFTPIEAFQLGLLKIDFPSNEIHKYLSRKRLTKIQEAINPVSWAPLLKNKGLFYRYCMDLGIPVPKLYAIFFRNAAGWSYNGLSLRNCNDWTKFFIHHLPSQFVIKPSSGFCGKGLNIFNRKSNCFIDASAKTYEPEQLYQALCSNREYDSFVIQQRLNNHPELLRLTGVEFLQTVRIITMVDTKNQSRIVHAHFKMITGENVADNFEHGISGNIESLISIIDGQLKPAVSLDPNGLGIRTISNHPKTKIAFHEFRVPLWDKACTLAEKTAPKFLPIRTIAWDIALTPDEPYIVEGNIWWYPLNQHQRMDAIVDMLVKNSQ